MDSLVIFKQIQSCSFSPESQDNRLEAKFIFNLELLTYPLQLISTPFHPAFLTPDRIQQAKKLRLALTAGIGSDHVDLPSAAKAGITVAEITGDMLFLL